MFNLIINIYLLLIIIKYININHLKYLDTLKTTGISAIGQTQAINKILEVYKTNPSSLEKEII
jgi:hypothetical protein